MNGFKKFSIRIFIILYGLSYFLQNTFSINRRKVYGIENPNTTKIVAIFVDKEIYSDIKTNLVRYTTKYIQKKIANSKAVVLPIDTTTLQAHEISQMLENMYFEGIEDESSKLIGTILIGDIPLPVVENNGFIYPSIYPYVDFEDQQFIFDTNKKFFVYNDNPNGQAELRHGMIKFDTKEQYNQFFTKVRSYYNNPTTFIDKAIRYEDFIGLKKYFIPENTKYYVNNMIFAEDIGYHRFNNLMLNILQNEHNQDSLAVGSDLNESLQNTDDANLQSYVADISAKKAEAETLSQGISSAMPTLTLKKATEEMLKGYDGLISSQFQAKVQDNVEGLARRYKSTDGETFTEYSSLTNKIAQKDNRLLGDMDSNIQPLLIQLNDYMEKELDTTIQEEKYYMTIPIPASKFDIKSKKVGIKLPRKCIWEKYNYYENYFFGQNVNDITNMQFTSIYRGTYKNLSSISGETIKNPLQSIGGTYDIFSTQVEANRGYDFNTTQEELDRYGKYKTNKEELRSMDCKGIMFFGYCIGRYTRKLNDSADENKCKIDNQDLQGGCQSMKNFAANTRGGASPMNINSTTQKLTDYNYKNAILPIYDIAGSKKIDVAIPEANYYQSAMTYTTLIKRRFSVGETKKSTNNSITNIIKNANKNGSDVKFTTSNATLDYTSSSFFTKFGSLVPERIAGKAILHNINTAGGCEVDGVIYTYKTIDTRIKNTAPTRDQVSNSEFYKFKDPSPLYSFYTQTTEDLETTQADIIEKNSEFIGTGRTGVISNLTKVKQIVASGNNGITEIIGYNYNNLTSMNATQVANKATDWSNKNLNPSKLMEMTGRIEIINAGLDELHNYVNALSIDNVWLGFMSIIKTESFKNQNVEILNTRKSSFTQDLNAIGTNLDTLKTSYTTAKTIYNSVGNINNNISAIQNQRNNIAWLHAGSGCNPTYYKSVCDVLDGIIALGGSIISANEDIDEIEEYEGDNAVTIQPFTQINTAFAAPIITTEISQIKNTINTFDVSTDSEKKEINKGMNLTTQDRPIDNIRNITFMGISGSKVQLNYPNLYEVRVYSAIDNKLILKQPKEIKEAIKTYLIGKATEHNTLLEAQKNNRNKYYQLYSAQFNFLGGSNHDPLANPMAQEHNYDLLPTEYYIDQVIEFLDKLVDEYGNEYVYGKNTPNTKDEKLDLIAKILYYQNITRPERTKQETVAEDMVDIKESFDINQKIYHVAQTYLTEGSDEGKFVTPMYTTGGYEVGYINSDRDDYVSAKPIPTFIKQIQTIQETTSEKKGTANAFVEQTASTLANVDMCEGVDTKGTALLAQLKAPFSPWGKAMICRAKQIFKKPFDIKISFKNALGPTVLGTMKELGNSVDNWTNDRKEYGAERSTPNNEEVIQQAPEEKRSILENYNAYSTINIDKTIIGVDDTGSAQIQIGMTQDIGQIKVRIGGAGDNCFGITRNGKVLSNDICLDKAEELYNPSTDGYVFDIVVNKKIAGSTAINVEFCLPIAMLDNICITKQQIMNTIPGPIDTIKIDTATDIIMEGGEVPLSISAKDYHGNEIGQSITPYTISVPEGYGTLYDGATENKSIQFSNFNDTASFRYRAPIGITENKSIPISILPQKSQTQLLITEQKKQVVAQKNIIVAKGIVTIEPNNAIENDFIYQSDTTNEEIQPIVINLPKAETDIQYYDEDNTAQIRPENISSIHIEVKDKNTNILDTVANITSAKGLVIPGQTTSNAIIVNNIAKQQITFNKGTDFIIKDGMIDIALYPSFKAGNDTITINIPGLDPISIPIIVNSGPAKTVLMKLEKTRLDMDITNMSTGTIQVIDEWNNKVTTGTKIKLGVIGAATTNTNEFTYTGKEYTYTITSKAPGGEGYVFAYIANVALTGQVPAYERFIVQESVLPESGLNIMYLNLFGTDRGNQRGYFSENDKVINTITSKSNKLLATTTELVDPNKIKQVEYIISPNGQIQSLNDNQFSLNIENNEFVINLADAAKIHIGTIENFTIQSVIDTGAISTLEKEDNTIIYIPEATDSVITTNEATKTKISINNTELIDLKKNKIDQNMIITMDSDTIEDMNSYTITLNDKKIGKLMIWRKNTITDDDVEILDPMIYGKTTVFREGSTNSKGIGIYVQSSAYSKQGYKSIEDSTDPMLGIGFSSDFKNIANFVNGKTIGEATVPYGSQFLINFGDPLLERRENNPEIPDTDFDASIGKNIYADPNKIIFQVVPIDFNKDKIQDLLIVYTDGTIKLLKSYGGKDPYIDPKNLMIIAEPIKEIKVGDMDDNGYDDIIILTTNNKGMVYLNEEGIFNVDGKYICINVNAEPEEINQNPEDFSQIQQLFIEDMNQDDVLDIVTLDTYSDIKIFYGGKTDGGANYISSTVGTCDKNRYTRQKNNYKTIKRFGLQINADRYIQDKSLFHWKGMEAPLELTEAEEEAENENVADPTAGMSNDELKAYKDKTMEDIKTMIADTDTYIDIGSSELEYTENPLDTSPIYETIVPENIYYLPTSELENHTGVVSAYKQYADKNGGVLRDGDKVVIKTTILSKKNINKLTYIDKLQGPRKIAKDNNNKIASLVFLEGSTGALKIDWNGPEGYQFVIDNIQLNTDQKLSFSYEVEYISDQPIVRIDVSDKDLLVNNIRKDGYPDLTVKMTDSCQKSQWIYINEDKDTKMTYEEIFNDVQEKINAYNEATQGTFENQMNAILDQMNNVNSLESVSSLPGMESLESWNAQNLISTIDELTQQGGISTNINVGNMIDNATQGVSKKLDKALKGLCQGFTVGGGCFNPLPFNQAFLAPGDYHIFGCVPKQTSILYPVFKAINTTIGKGMPLLNIPAGLTTPVGQIPFFGIFGFPQKSSIPGAEDGFFLGGPGGLYPSQFRLYIAPTLTMGIGIAMCFGPYSIGKALPKPFRDMGGNCIVFAFSPKCGGNDETQEPGQPTRTAVDEDMTEAADQGTCNTPPATHNTIIFEPDNQNTQTTSANSPFQLVTAVSSENIPNYAAAIPDGNFGGLFSIDKDPIIESIDDYYGASTSVDETMSYEGYTLKKATNTQLKIIGAKTKGLVKCLVSDWMTRQIQYVQNNLTKMTIQIDLPNLATAFEGFDKIGNLQETYKSINEQDEKSGYTNRDDKLSKQQIHSLSNSIGDNPFEAIQQLFKDVPLINIDTQTISVKIPSITSEDVNAYISYLEGRMAKNQDIINDRGELLESLKNFCGVGDLKESINNIQDIKKELSDLENLQKNQGLTEAQKAKIAELSNITKKVDKCFQLEGQLDKFISFKENSAGLIRSIKQNIIVLEKYKEFPTQLYQWMHLTDRYLTEIAGLLSDFVGSITYWLDINANRFSQYVDAITMIVGAIHTWQAIIDLSVNRSAKCSKCSNDNYGGFSCSLSLLCPKLPIFPIPAFKIPNIYMDMSHIELGMNILLPKMQFVPTRIPLPQLPDLPEPPNVDINLDVLFGLDFNFFENVSLPTVPVIPEPPTLPEPPSFIPSIKIDLPVLPPAPRVPKIAPEFEAILSIGEFIGKVFCIIKGGIGLVGEKGVKGKIEQITQRTRNVPIFDYFDMTTKYKNAPLQGFDYKLDAYATLKFNFDGVYDVFNNIATVTNNMVTQGFEAPIQKAVEQVSDAYNNNGLTDTGFDAVEDFNLNINGYNNTSEETGMIEYNVAYNEFKNGLTKIKNVTLDDTAMNNRIKKILAVIENKSTVTPATQKIQEAENAAQTIIKEKREENQKLQEEIKDYDSFIKKLKNNDIILVNDTTTQANISTPLLTIDSTSKSILQSQENPTKTYLSLNKKMVEGYLDAVNNDGAEKLNMSTDTYKKSKKYLETTKEKIDTALLAYTDKDETTMLAQGSTCTTCGTTSEETKYSTDITTYMKGVYAESYTETGGIEQKSMINTVASTLQAENVQKKYMRVDLNNDDENKQEIVMYDNNNIYIKYPQQETEHLSEGGNALTTYYTKFYSYASEHTLSKRYIDSLDQLRENSDAYGYMKINDIRIKIVDENKEVKNYTTKGQTFDTLQLEWKNSVVLGEDVDGYIIKLNNRVDNKDISRSFLDIFRNTDKAKYIVVLPKNTEYQKGLITIDKDTVKKPINLELGESILAIEYYDPAKDNSMIILKDLERKRLYANIATLTIHQDELSNNQKESFTLYKKSSPRSNQIVAGMQNLGDLAGPEGSITLWRDRLDTVVSTGISHEGYINTSYSLKSTRTDNVAVTKMIVQKDGVTIAEKDNDTQTGTIDIPGLFFTGTTKQTFDFIAIDQNNNITKEIVILNIKIPDIEVIDLKKSGTETAEIVAKISNDMDEGLVVFQRLRNGIWKNIDGTAQTEAGGFELSPLQTIITGGIFTIGNDIGLYDDQGNEIATINPKSGEIHINQEFEDTIQIHLNFNTHIPVVEIRDIEKSKTLFQIILPIETINDIQLDESATNYQQIQLINGEFGDFNNGYCIKNNKNDCIVYTNNKGAIYIPGTYANSLVGEYTFDTNSQNTIFTIKDQTNNTIATLKIDIKQNK